MLFLIFQVGMTTEEIDSIVHHEIIRRNAYPSPLGYGGFPKSVCTSVNNVVCHGIPDRYFPSNIHFITRNENVELKLINCV